MAAASRLRTAHPSNGARPGPAVIERASPTDLALLALDSPENPEQFGVLLRVDACSTDVPRLVELIAARIRTIPRLRQRLLRVPLGCGRPVWIDDEGYRDADHIRVMPCPRPGDESALLEAAQRIVAEPLSRRRPLWTAVFLTGLAHDRVALVVVLHHVLADGLGGLEVLAHLADRPCQPEMCAESRFPRPRPETRALAHAAFRQRLIGLGHIADTWRLLVSSMAGAGGVRPPRMQPCSLNRRTGPRRRLLITRCAAFELRAAVHRLGGTTNDAVLVAVGGALARVLATRGERVERLSMVVPVSGRRPGASSPLGNLVSPMLVSVPTSGPVAQRVTTVAAQVRSKRSSATGPPPIALLGGLFRMLAATGGFRWYMNHQRRLHTLVSHVRGPSSRRRSADT
jgi:WS/DGAT/MGAT family acyltransferase